MHLRLGRAPVALAISAIGVLWGTSFLFTRLALDGFSAPTVTFLRLAIAALVTVAITSIVAGRAGWASLRGVPAWLLIGLALFNAAVPYGLITLAQQHVESSTAAVYNATVPILTIMLAVATGRETRPGLVRVLGTLVGFAGILVMTGFALGVVDRWTFALVGAALSYATAFVLAAHPAARAASGPALAASQLSIGAVVIAPILAMGTTGAAAGAGPWLAVIALAVVSTAVPGILFYRLVRMAGSTRASLVTYVVPLVGVAAGWAILGEVPEVQAIGGALLVLLGLTFTRWGDASRRRKEDDNMAHALEVLEGARMIDLSVELAEELPAAWPGHMPFRHQIGNWFATRTDLPQPLAATLGPYQTRWMVMDEHTGTHLDAPSHGIDPGDAELGALSVSVETIGLDQVRGMAAVIEVTDDGRGDHTVVTVADIERHEIEHGPLTAGTIVLVRTGWDARYLPGAAGRSYAAGPLAGTERGWPALDVDAMAALIERGIRCVGTDAPSIGAANTGGPVHDVGFRHGLVFIEGLARLHELPARGAYVMALPLRLRGGTGSPVRAVALVEEAR